MNITKEPEIPMSYPKRRPLEAATMQVMMIKNVNLLPTLVAVTCVSIENPPPAIF